MLNIDKFKVDEKKELDGAPLVWNGFTFFVKRMNSAFQSELRNMIVELGNANGEVDQDKDDFKKRMCDNVADNLLAGWSGLKLLDDDGNETDDFKFSKENARELLNYHQDLADEIFIFSENRNNYLVARREAKAKN